MRTFVAIEIEQNLKEKIYKFITTSQAQIKSNKISWVKKENLHVTLKFIGEIEEKKVENIKEVLNKLIKNFTQFSFSIRNIGVFPDVKKPRVIWLGIEDKTKILGLLSKEIEDELFKIGLPKENKEFVSHLTIGRIKNLTNVSEIEKYIRGNPNTDFGENKVEFITFFQSILKPEGPTYIPIEKFYLKNL